MFLILVKSDRCRWRNFIICILRSNTVTVRWIIVNIFRFPRGRSRELSTRTTRPTPLSSSTGPRQRGERALLNTLVSRTPLQPVPAISLVPPFLLRHPKLELRGKRARAKGKETVHYLETKKKKQLSTLEIRETLIFFDRSSSWKGGRRRKEKARSILWELNSPLSFEGGEE